MRTGVLQSGQSRMSRSSWLRAMWLSAGLFPTHSSRRASPQATSPPFAAAEFADDLRGVAVLAVHGVIHPPHVALGHAPGKVGERSAQRGNAVERGAAHDRHGIVGGEVMPAVFARHKIPRLTQPLAGLPAATTPPPF